MSEELLWKINIPGMLSIICKVKNESCFFFITLFSLVLFAYLCNASRISTPQISTSNVSLLILAKTNILPYIKSLRSWSDFDFMKLKCTEMHDIHNKNNHFNIFFHM